MVGNTKKEKINSNTFIRCGISFDTSLAQSSSDTEYQGSHFIDTINTVNGGPVYYYSGKTDFDVPSNAGQVILVSCARASIENMVIHDCNYGISLFHSSKIDIRDSNVTGGRYQLWITKSNDVTVENNVFQSLVDPWKASGSSYAIYWTYSQSGQHIITNNTIKTTTFGIYMRSNDNCLINKNSLDIIGAGISISETDFVDIENNVILLCKDNNIDITSSDDVTITNNTAYEKSCLGSFLRVNDSKRCKADNNTLGTHSSIFYLSKAEDCVISNNSIVSVSGVGFLISSLCNDVLIVNNSIEGCAYGIRCTDDSVIQVMDNIFDNNKYGVCLGSPTALKPGVQIDSWIIKDNSISNSICGIYIKYPGIDHEISFNSLFENDYGIQFVGAQGNEVHNNSFKNNGYGLYNVPFSYSGTTYQCEDNWIHHNNFITNTNQAYDTGANYYDDDHGHGNYWSDYTGIDDGSGFGRKGEAKVAGDGIGDTKTPHLSLDWYPFMSESGWLNRPPVADAGADLTGNVDVAVQFDGSSSYDPDGAIVSYDWDWGDGSAHGSGATPTHTYASKGAYTVTLTVADDKGATAKDTCLATVYVPPVVVIAGDDQVLETVETGTFDGSDSYDPDGSIVSYDWDWGDGSDHGTDAISTHSYANHGAYDVTLTVTDNDGVTTSSTITVTVCDVPTIPELLDRNGVTDVSMDFDGSGASDPDGTIVSYDWDWGDGTDHGTGATPSHTYTENGAYTATLTVTDGQGMTASASFDVAVYDAPVIIALEDRTGVADREMTFDGSGSYDPDGEIVSYDWDWGDDTDHGTGETSTHTYAEAGVYTATFTVTDSQGIQTSSTFEVTVYDAPVIPEMEDMTGVSGVEMDFDASDAYDPDGSIVSYDWDWGDSSTYGSGATPSHVYAADGTYTVTLKVTDSQGVITTTTFSVTVHDAPVAVISASSLKLFWEELGSFDGTGSYDPDGSIVSYDWDWGDGSDHNTTSTAMHNWTAKGTYTVTLTVTDDDGISSSATVTVTVVTPCAGLKDLIALLYSFNLKQGINNSLDAKLAHTQEALCNIEKQNFNEAKNSLKSFENEVEAQSGKILTTAQADQLLMEARRIIDAIPAG